jgi:1-acyl-sn-glycerol-3-phosphate acyltransferase
MSADPAPGVERPAEAPPGVERAAAAAPSAGAGRLSTSDNATRRQLAFYAFCRAAVAGFAYLFWRTRVTGRDNIPRQGPFILSPVHRSNVDTPLMGCVTRRRMRYMGKDSMWKYRWSAWFFTSLGGIPVRRGTPDREALRASEAAVRSGEPIVIFPEGTRRSGPIVEDIFEGAPFVAVRTGVPIIPVGIGGSEGAMPKGARMLRPVKVRIVVGPPLYPPPREQGGRGARRQVHELTGRLHAELQRVFDQAQALAHGKSTTT